MSLERDLSLLEETDLFDPYWYETRYRDTKIMGLEAARHYLLYGAELGRDPGPTFSTRAYWAAYRDVAESGMNPLVHYLRFGLAEGRSLFPPGHAPMQYGPRFFTNQRHALYVQGHETGALERLKTALERAENACVQAHAARELALWYLRGPSLHDPGLAKSYVDQAKTLWDRCDDAEGHFLTSLRVLQLVCDASSDLPPPGESELGQASDDVLLARAHFEAAPQERLGWINRVLARHGADTLHLLPEQAGSSPFDQLAANSGKPMENDAGQPVVSVLVAAHNAQTTLPCALRSLQAQSWRNLEIIVIDDASTDGTVKVVQEAIACDTRIRLVQMPRNGGAYVARNAGLDAATGEFVTLHDADDWAHPDRIACQVAHLLKSTDIGCTSEQVRLSNDLLASRMSPEATFVIENTSSYLFRRGPMQARLGYWDTVRVSADSELIRRAEHVFGPAGVRRLQTGPLAFQRDHDMSAVRDPALGINGYAYGARRDYREAQLHFHVSVGDPALLKYSAQGRPFPVPAIMLPNRPDPDHRTETDLVIAGDFRALEEGEKRMPASLLGAMVSTQRALRSGRSVGLVQCDHDDPERAMLRIHPALRDMLQRARLPMFVHGETVPCDVLEIHDPGAVAQSQRYRPRLLPREVRIMVHAPPRNPRVLGARAAYAPAWCDTEFREQFGVTPKWWPQSAAIATALQRAAPELDLARIGEEEL